MKKVEFSEVVKAWPNESIDDHKGFYVIVKSKKVVGMVRLESLSDKIDAISSLWVHKNERGSKLGHFLLIEG